VWHNSGRDICFVPASPLAKITHFVRLQDFVWLLFFGVLFATNEYRDLPVILPLVALTIVQIVEPRIPALSATRRHVVWIIILKLAFGYMLIGFTNGILSNFWLVLLLPVVSAATALGIVGTLIFTFVAGGAYLSFLIYLDFGRFAIQWPEVSILLVRVTFLAMVGMLANTLAEDLRTQSEKNRRTAEELARTNEQLQKAEEAVRRSDRLAALGQLSAGLAHELRNPLGTIKASAEMLERTVSSENEVAREVSGFIRTEVDRTNSLITRFLDFARPLQLRVDRADLSQTLDRAVAAAERETPQVTIYKNYAPEIPPFAFDAELLERVFFNLIVNAAQATEPGGAVTVKTRSAGSKVEVAIIDRGSGIDPKNLDAIFNPFFTTKPTGVGLGLAIVAKIVDQHGGKIAVESEPGKGSVFRVLLPMAVTIPELSRAIPEMLA
jgi:two-component system, NtrC family, sensor histidine kinase HydH